MSRSRASAKAAGSRFERVIADYLKEHVSSFIDRRVKTGGKDKGDIANLRAPLSLDSTRYPFGKIVAELKDYGGRFEVGTWLNEADVERGNDDALAGVVIAKRRGTTDPGDQVVFMTVRDLVALLTGVRP